MTNSDLDVIRKRLEVDDATPGCLIDRMDAMERLRQSIADRKALLEIIADKDRVLRRWVRGFDD